MPIQLNSKLSSAVANATWLDKTQDDSTTGKLELNNSDIVSGAAIANTQREINKNAKAVNSQASLLDADQITLDDLSMSQVFPVIGNGAPVTLNGLLFSNQPLNGSEITIIGQSDTDTVTINFNDVQFGQFINGNATLKRGYCIRFIYDSGSERFYELSRNF